MLTFQSILSARQVIAGKVHLTPAFSSERLGTRIGARLLIKAENFQKTGSFKPRGVLNRLAALSAEEKAQGLITVSAGNHAGALAWGARQAGVKCTVVMPETAPQTKVNAARGYGAEVILHGGTPEAFVKMQALRQERNLILVHPFDDELIIAGQGTIGLEIFEQVPEVTKVVVPIGGGGLIAGIALAIKQLKPGVKVYGVEPEGAAAMWQSWQAGKAIHLDKVNTVADGLSAPMATDLTYALCKQYVDDIAVLTDEQIVDGLRQVLVNCKLMPEPAGAAGVAALLCGKIPVEANDVIVAVVSGGNIDLSRLKEFL